MRRIRLKPRRQVRGFALVAVLLTLGLLSLIAASMLSEGHIAYQVAHYSDQRARLEGLAEAGVARAILALADRRPAARWRADGGPMAVRLLGSDMTIRIEDERGKIDLNTADPKLLAGLFSSAGLDADAAASLTDKVLDWREPGEARRLNGAKAGDYHSAGYPYRPRGGPFQRVDELRLVMGMTADLFRRVEPALTVYSALPSIDLRTAPRQALLALPGMTPEAVDKALEARKGTAVDGAGTGSVVAPVTSSAGLAYTIRVEVEAGDGEKLTVTSVVRLTEDPRSPYWILAWNQG